MFNLAVVDRREVAALLKKLEIGLVLALLVALPATAQDFQKGFDAAKRGDFAVALKEWQPLAEKGNIDAQYNLAVMYANGQGVPKDYSEARNWLRKPIKQGHSGAQFFLGLMYANGQGLQKDHAEAVKWYRKAASQGYDDAQNSLGVMYYRGQGVKQDYAQALKWYREAAAQGNPQAQFNLSLMEASGQGDTTKVPPPKVSLRAASTIETIGKASLPPDTKVLVDPELKPSRPFAERPLKGAGTAAEVPSVRHKTQNASQHAKVLKALKALTANISNKSSRPAVSGFRVQLSAIKTRDRGVAAKEAVRLTQAFNSVLGSLEVKPVRADLGERGIYYRLQAGPLADRSSANALCGKLSARNQDCVIIQP